MTGEFWTSLVTIHGPLALGWVVAGVFIVAFIKMHDRLITTLNDNTMALTAMKTLLDERTRWQGSGGGDD